MLRSEAFVQFNPLEQHLFARLMPQTHFLRQLEQVVDFERVRSTLADHDCPGEGGTVRAEWHTTK